MKEAYFNTIYSVTDHVPQFSYTFPYKASHPSGLLVKLRRKVFVGQLIKQIFIVVSVWLKDH